MRARLIFLLLVFLCLNSITFTIKPLFHKGSHKEQWYNGLTIWHHLDSVWRRPNVNIIFHFLYTATELTKGKRFEPRGINYIFGVIVQVKVVIKKTVVGDSRFDYLSGSHLHSQAKSRRQMTTVFLKTTSPGRSRQTNNRIDKNGDYKWPSIWKQHKHCVVFL